MLTYFSLSSVSVTCALSIGSNSGLINGCGFLMSLLRVLTLADRLSLSIDDNRLAMCSCFLFCWSKLQCRVACLKEKL